MADPVVVITNSDAGNADAAALDAALTVLRAHVSVEVQATANPGELDGVLHRVGSRRIVVAGGDGSLHAVVAALHRRNELTHSTLGLLPLGTGNDFARSLDIPLDPEAAAHALIDGAPQRMDLLVDEVGGVVVNAVHVGAGAVASKHGEEAKSLLGKAKLGRLGYPIGAARTAWNPPILRLRVAIDGAVVTDVDSRVLMLAVGNGVTVGGGLKLTPGADPTDGQAEVMISHATGPISRLVYAARLAVGSHPSAVDVQYVRGTEVSVSGEAFWVSADGETYGPERHRTWRLEPAAYAMICPAADSAGE